MIVSQKEKHIEVIYEKMGEILDPDLPMWVLSHERYIAAQLPQILKRCKKIMIWTFIASFTQHPEIIQNLATPAFPRLRVLVLESNNIESIDFLSFIEAPQLTHLMLSKNIISSIQPLRKTHLNSLSVLSISQNKFKSIEELPQCNFTSMFSLDLSKNPIISILNIYRLNESEILEFLHLSGINAIWRAAHDRLLEPEMRFQNPKTRNYIKRRWNNQ